MNFSWANMLIISLVALISVEVINPKVRRIAVSRNIVDNPDARKLQRRPVPLLGGLSVFFGILIGLCVARMLFNSSILYPIIVSMVIMLYFGTADDIVGLSPSVRFGAEIFVVIAMMSIHNFAINDFHGLWGIHRIPDWFAWLFTIFAVVGIINSINLIDGVDGLSSGFCIMSSLLFGILFFYAGDYAWASLAVVCVGALLPFFLHNVFGKKSKMFIGDGGTLVMGVVISSFVIRTLQSDSLVERYFNQDRISLVAFSLAALSIPVFDTVRVMGARIVRGHSPFKPDKTHLHHLFISMGYSHIGTTVRELSLNAFVVLCWWISFILGASVNVQCYVVIGVSLLITWGFYRIMASQVRKETRFIRQVRRVAYGSHIERKGVWYVIQKVVDKFYNE
ncbi:MAG: undecaprenyl/decaprenyl-phosphate alpha-N-acetylglucosaminyl 1-phosphate transferase [Bacteroidales bacterium]|nr:undecaprenyl/decaprenyl-phosphate alpha-N-acetylglucosaminyl 1-phosphate transferase [Bacteroidales bacterium]